MFMDLTTLKTRYYELTLTDADGHVQTVHVKPAKIKTLGKITTAIKELDNDNPDLSQLISAIAKLISSNQEHISFTQDDLGELSLDALLSLVTDYFAWLQNSKKN